MTEKQLIERATGDAFTTLFNLLRGTDYVPVEYRDAPDVRCVDSEGSVLNVEVTLTEDRPGDIKARLGRSEDRSLPVLKAHPEKVKAGLADPLERVSCLNTNVGRILVQRIRAKMNKRYGPNTALVVRDTSGVDWDWDLVADTVKESLDLIANPFDQGIWVLSTAKDRIFRVV
jgi:hypothetical protein